MVSRWQPPATDHAAEEVSNAIHRHYGVLDEAEGMAPRGLFIIDPEGILRYQVVHDEDVGRNASETMRVLQALQSGGLCPMDWQPGQPTR